MQFSANSFKSTFLKVQFLLFCFAIPLTAVARTESLQADSLSAFTRDTVYNSEPMTEYISFGHIITAGYGYAIVPITIVLGAASISSPTYVMEFDKIYGNHTGFSFGAGVGIDFNEEEGIGFSDIRAQFDYTRLANHPVSPNRSTGSLLADINFMPIFRENIFRLGGSIGPGITISEEVPRYHIQGELWIRNAMGLSYLGLFPQHQLFIRSRYTIGLHNSMPRYDIALGYAATISISKEFFYDFIP